jgi:hypothetical protein
VVSQRGLGGFPHERLANPKGGQLFFVCTLRFSLNSPALLGLNKSRQIEAEFPKNSLVNFSAHQQCHHESGCQNTLNNLRLIAQPLLLFWLIDPWIHIFPRF